VEQKLCSTDRRYKEEEKIGSRHIVARIWLVRKKVKGDETEGSREALRTKL